MLTDNKAAIKSKGMMPKLIIHKKKNDFARQT